MILQEVRKELRQVEDKMQFGDKKLIAAAIGEKYENVIAAFRGMGGKQLSIRVVQEAYKIKKERDKEIRLFKKMKTKAA